MHAVRGIKLLGWLFVLFIPSKAKVSLSLKTRRPFWTSNRAYWYPPFIGVGRLRESLPRRRGLNRPLSQRVRALPSHVSYCQNISRGALLSHNSGDVLRILPRLDWLRHSTGHSLVLLSETSSFTLQEHEEVSKLNYLSSVTPFSLIIISISK